MMWSLYSASPGELEILMALEIPREYTSLAYDDQPLEYIESFVG
jgi:hypothetical protein